MTLRIAWWMSLKKYSAISEIKRDLGQAKKILKLHSVSSGMSISIKARSGCRVQVSVLFWPSL